jgi:hypothetical protein
MVVFSRLLSSWALDNCIALPLVSFKSFCLRNGKKFWGCMVTSMPTYQRFLSLYRGKAATINLLAQA